MGKFSMGNQLSKGRPAGSLNRRTLQFRLVLEAGGFCPATALMDTYNTALAKFNEELKQVKSGKLSPMESKAVTYLRTALDSAKELASYTYPKLKCVEQEKPSNILDGMSDEEKLKLMKDGVAYMENIIKNAAEQ